MTEKGEKGDRGQRGETGATPDLSRLETGVNALRAEIAEERQANEERIRVGSRLIRAAVFASLLGVIVGVLGLYSARDAHTAATKAQEAIDLSTAQRNEARVTSCNEDNRGRRADQQSALALATPEALARAEEEGGARLQQALDFLSALRPQRDCTPEGIERYFESDAAEGVLPFDLPSHVAEFLDRHRPSRG